jgi:hypothetical protein
MKNLIPHIYFYLTYEKIESILARNIKDFKDSDIPAITPDELVKEI